jgi:hypothetical protein
MVKKIVETTEDLQGERHIPHAKEAENDELDWVKHLERLGSEGVLVEGVFDGIDDMHKLGQRFPSLI